jgi:fibronectin type 3 domain-containing protein
VAPLIEAIQPGDSTISLTWHRHGTQGAFSGFYVERSTDGKTFRRLTEQPYIQSQPDADVSKRDTVRFQTDSLGQSLISFSDSVVNYRRFSYRIIGIDAFGDLSPASEIVSAMARDLTPPRPPRNLRTQVINNRHIRVQWNEAGRMAPDMAGYVIGRGTAVNGPFESISANVLPTSTLEFLDTKPGTYSNFYAVGAVDTAGNIAYAPAVVGIIADLRPPDTPTGLTAQTDTGGVVRLMWPLGQDDDIVAYKVYRSYELQNDFYRQLTPLGIADTTFADTLPHPMLNKQVFYKIVAIDRTGNHSLFSAALPVAVPDRMPPAAPVIRSVVVDAGGVTLTVLPSSSVDVVGHRLYRRDGDAPWTLLRQLPGRSAGPLTLRDTSFRAQPGFAGKTYTYALTAVDDAKLESERSFAVPVQPGAGIAQSVRNVQGRYDADRRAVVLNWEFPTLAEPYHFVVYRALNGEGLSMYRAVDGQQRSFLDNATALTGRYQYAVRVQYHQRSGSPLSQTISISR